MQLKRTLIVGTLVVLAGGIATYFVAPAIVRGVVVKRIEANPMNSVQDVSISWGGPQRITGLRVASGSGHADIDVVIENSLVSLLSKNTSVKVGVRGDATYVIQKSVPKTEQPKQVKVTSSPKRTSSHFPEIELQIQLNSVTIEGDEPMQFKDVQGSLDVTPGRHFTASLSAKTDMDGMVTASCNAPNLIDVDGNTNWKTGGTLTFDITNTAIPTINGAGGWSVTEMEGEISSPDFTESLNIAINGTLAEYDIPRGAVHIKTQLADPVQNGAFVFNDRNLVGSIDLDDVPTSILAPLVGAAYIDTSRDLGPTMNIRIERIEEGPPLVVRFTSRDLQVSGIVDQDNGIIRNIDIVADVHSELLEALTGGELTGNAKGTLRLDQLVPAGHSSNDEPECLGQVAIEGELKHLPSLTTINSIDAAISADVGERSFETLGGITIDNHRSKFHIQLRNDNTNNLDGLDDLFKTLVKELPIGSAIELKDLPTTVVQQYITEDSIDLARDIGETMNINATISQDHADVEVTSKQLQVTARVNLQGKEISGFSDVTLSGTIEKELAELLTGAKFGSSSTITAQLERIGLDGTSSFRATFNIGNQKTLLQGSTTRTESSGSLNLTLAATGIDTRLIDAMCNSSGVLFDSIGSPATLELLVTDILENPTVIAGGSSEKATFESSLGFFDGNVFTIKDTTSQVDLVLSTSLTQHVLKDLGPILSDIRSMDHPIKITISNANVSLEGDLSKLNADLRIDIGAVELDSGSLTMQLLPAFGSSHIRLIPASFDPIHIEIRNGVVHYKKFNLIIDKKYSIPHSGTINLITRKLDLKTSIPLTGLGYSIKELRNLETDIDVPLITTGTIEEHVTMVDPEFDLSKILESVKVELIGDAIDDFLGIGTDDDIDPLKFIEDLLGGG